MFTDETLDPVEFKSSWKKERSVADCQVQTQDLPTRDVIVQSVKRKHVQVQTDEDAERSMHGVEGDPAELVDFLKSAEPFIIKQLQSNRRSHAFDGYEVNWQEETDSVSVLHSLTHATLEGQLEVTGISWSATGSVLAASFGRFDHEDWCTHKSTLCTWNLERRGMNASKPDTVVDLSSCLMCISCHPQHPAWIAGGTFNGEVLVWDLGRDDEMLIATSGIGDDSHREPVSKVYWIPDADPKNKKFNLVSVSTDGKMLVWQLYIHQQALRLIDGFILLTESLPRSLRARAKRGDQEMGVTCVSYTPEDRTTFFIGSESGGVFKCSEQMRGSPAGRDVVSSIPLRSPVTFSYNPHHGPVYSIECSPYHRNLFLTCAMDASVRIYSILQTQALMTVEPGAGYLYSAKWSPVRPLVFAVSAEDGSVLVYDLKHSQGAPLHRLQANSKKQPVYTMQFNHRQPQLLATGDAGGTIQVWQLSDDLTQQSNKEIELLDEIASSIMDAAE